MYSISYKNLVLPEINTKFANHLEMYKEKIKLINIIDLLELVKFND